MAGTLSAFFDECGQENKFQPDTKYYLLTVVLHDQSNPIDALIAGYEANLRESAVILASEKQKGQPHNGLTRSFVAGCTRLELATSDVTGRRSNQLS